MSAWGVLTFENDEANDWAYGLDNVSDLSLVASAFDTVEAATEYLEAPEACSALAACEALARLLGKPGYHDSFTETVDLMGREAPVETISGASCSGLFGD